MVNVIKLSTKITNYLLIPKLILNATARSRDEAPINTLNLDDQHIFLTTYKAL